MSLKSLDWGSMLGLESHPLEMIARGTILYLAIMVFLRLMPRRAGNQLAAMDLVFLLLVTEAASHSLGDFTSVADGVVMIVTLVALDYLANALSYRSKFFERLLLHRAVQIVRDGKLMRREMRREFLTEDELNAHLRTEGIEDLSEVKKAFVEADGQLTVIKTK